MISMTGRNGRPGSTRFGRARGRSSWGVTALLLATGVGAAAAQARPAPSVPVAMSAPAPAASAPDGRAVAVAVDRRPDPGSAAKRHPAAWQKLPAAPIRPLDQPVAVWTGREMLIAGEVTNWNTDAVKGYAVAYNPTTRTWRRLPAPSGHRQPVQGTPQAVWTGREMIVLGGDFQEAYNPSTNRWRHLNVPTYGQLAAGFAMVWTGRLVFVYGGGCCDGADDSAATYDPATNRWRPVRPALGARWTTGAWTGHEVVVAGGHGQVRGRGDNVDLATAAAYDPGTGRWRTLPTMPRPLWGDAVWDGARVVVVGPGGAFAYSPRRDVWTVLPAGFDRRWDASVVAAAGRVLVVGGAQVKADGLAVAPATSGLSFSRAEGWRRLPPLSLTPRTMPVAVWTGRQLVIWGGASVGPDSVDLNDGASLTLG